MNPYSLDHTLNTNVTPAHTAGDVVLECYPQDLRDAVQLADDGQVNAGYAILHNRFLTACDQEHEPMKRVYGEALAVFEQRYNVLPA